MATTVKKILLDVRALLDELSKKGTLLPDASVIDLQLQGIRFVDLAQKELYRIGNVFKKFEITRKPAVNLLGANHQLIEFIGVDQTYGNHVAKAYYFEADDDGTVYVEELDGTILETITTTEGMKSYKGLINSNNPVRLRFSGTTFYRHQNRALYEAPFKLSQIPDFKPWIAIDMPADFRQVDSVIEEYPVRQYSLSSTYKWEGLSRLVVNYYYEGTIRVIYHPVPVTITSVDDVLEVDDITANAIVYYVAAKIAPHEMAELTNFFEQKYNELKYEVMRGQPSLEASITDVYGVNYGNI